MMTIRSLFLAFALLAAGTASSLAQTRDDVVAAPVLRANVNVASDVVRIGDVVDNAGPAAQIAIYRAPDLGTTGSLPTAQVLSVLRAHQVIGVDTRDLKAISVTRLARTLEAAEIELQVARALERRSGLGDAANLSLTFDRGVQTLQLDASNGGALQPVSARYDQRSGRFDVSFEVANDVGSAATKLRFTGIAIETVEVAVLARGVERNEIIKSSDVLIERRPKAEVGNDVAGRDGAVGMQARRQLRAGQALRIADLAKPDLVTRDQNVTLIYEIFRAVSHHPRQGAGGRHRRRRGQCAQSAIQAHGVRRRGRPRPGVGCNRCAPPCRRRRRIHDDRRESNRRSRFRSRHRHRAWSSKS